MRHFDLKLKDGARHDIHEAEVARRFVDGEIGRTTPCRFTGTQQWTTVDECLPLLKYGVTGDWPMAATPQRKRNVRDMLLGAAAGGAMVALVVSGLYAFHPPGRATPAPIHNAPALLAASGPRAAQTPQPTVPQAAPTTTPRPSKLPQRSVTPRAVQAAQTAAPPRAPSVARVASQVEEFTIPLEKWSPVPSRYGSFHVLVRDHGVVSITVWVDYDRGRRIDKVKGFETTQTNIVQIHSLARAKVYYVDRIAVSSGYCVLKVIPDDRG